MNYFNGNLSNGNIKVKNNTLNDLSLSHFVLDPETHFLGNVEHKITLKSHEEVLLPQKGEAVWTIMTLDSSTDILQMARVDSKATFTIQVCPGSKNVFSIEQELGNEESNVIHLFANKETFQKKYAFDRLGMNKAKLNQLKE